MSQTNRAAPGRAGAGGADGAAPGAPVLRCTPLHSVHAALGASFEVETLDGERTVSVRAGTQSGDSIRLGGLGVGRLRRPGRGDLHVSIVVETPTRLTERERELLTELAVLRGEDGHAPAEADSLFDRITGKHKKRR